MCTISRTLSNAAYELVGLPTSLNEQLTVYQYFYHRIVEALDHASGFFRSLGGCCKLWNSLYVYI